MDEELYVDEEGCDDCIYKYWIQSTGRAVSGLGGAGWACELTGGHAIVRCKSYVSRNNENNSYRD